MSKISNFRLFAACAFAGLLTACGGEQSDTDNEVLVDITPEKEAFYAANPDRFRFRSLDELPENLEWENGMGLSEIGSSDAIKGGTYYDMIQDFPSTLRLNGPDANGSFAFWNHEGASMMLADRHPNDLE